MSSKVQLLVYDVSRGMARTMSPMLLGKQIDVIPHTGVLIWGKEYFFGGGVCVAPQGQFARQNGQQPVEVIELGTAEKSESELNSYLATDLMTRFTEQTYNLLHHNCNHFSDAVVKFVTNNKQSVPARIVNVADEALSTPQGQQLRGMIEGFDRAMRNNSGGSQFNPYGNSTGQNSAIPTPTNPPAINNPLNSTNTTSNLSSSSVVNPNSNALSGTVSTGKHDISELNEAFAEMDKCEKDSMKKRVCVGLLCKMVQNIIKSPSEDKFKKIKMDNKAFTSKVGECGGGTELVMALGFSPEEVDGVENWVWKEESIEKKMNMDKLKLLWNELNRKLNVLGGPLDQKPIVPEKPAGSTAGGTGGGLPGGLPAGIPADIMNHPMAQQLMNNPAQLQQLMNQFGGGGR